MSDRAKPAASRQPKPLPTTAELLSLADLTDGVWRRLRDGERFAMCVPAQPDHDMDLILSRAATTLRHLAAFASIGAAGLPIALAPRDGTMLRLLVRYDEGRLEDTTEPQWTIGFNNLGNTGEDIWQFAGWHWCQDCFIDGDGEVLAWRPFHSIPAAEPRVQAEGEDDPAPCTFCGHPVRSDPIEDCNGEVACQSCGNAEMLVQSQEAFGRAFLAVTGRPLVLSADHPLEEAVQEIERVSLAAREEGQPL